MCTLLYLKRCDKVHYSVLFIDKILVQGISEDNLTVTLKAHLKAKAILSPASLCFKSGLKQV